VLLAVIASLEPHQVAIFLATDMTATPIAVDPPMMATGVKTLVRRAEVSLLPPLFAIVLATDVAPTPRITVDPPIMATGV
jgi:hypothetical protein